MLSSNIILFFPFGRYYFQLFSNIVLNKLSCQFYVANSSAFLRLRIAINLVVSIARGQSASSLSSYRIISVFHILPYLHFECFYCSLAKLAFFMGHVLYPYRRTLTPYQFIDQFFSKSCFKLLHITIDIRLQNNHSAIPTRT